MANPLNNSFENWTGGNTVCTNWTVYSVNGGLGLIGAPYSGSHSINCRSSGAAPVSSIGGFISDSFDLANDYITFYKYDQNASVAPTVRIFNSSDVELKSVDIPAKAGAWQKYCLYVGDLKGQNVKIRFEQHTTASGQGFYTYIDLVACSDTISGCALLDYDISLAKNGTATSSSNHWDNCAPGNAIDSDISTRWMHDVGQSLASSWWKVDLGAEYHIDKVILRAGAQDLTYDISVSINDVDWIKIIDAHTKVEDAELLVLDTTCRYIKVHNFASSSYYGQIFEFLAFEYSLGYFNTDDYSYYRKLTIASSLIDTTLTDFPVLVKLTNSNFNFNNVKTDLSDIRFVAADKTTELKYELDSKDSTPTFANFWVKLPSISSSADTDFYIYYNNPLATNGEDAANVWDSDYKGVWHLQETCNGTSGEIKDSTSNAYDLTGQSPYLTQEDGFIGKALNGGSNGYAKRPSDDNDLDLTGDFIIEWKMRWDSSVTACSIMGKSQGGGSTPKWVLNYGGIYGQQKLNFLNTNSWVQFPWIPSADTDYNCALRRSGNSWKFFVNNVQTGGTQTDSMVVPNTTQAFHLFTDGEAWQYFDSQLDEVRITKGSSRSDAYVKAAYNSEINNLITYGAMEGANQLIPSFQWQSSGVLSKSLGLQWIGAFKFDKSLQMQWKTKYDHRFCPNLINYEFDFLTPTVYSSKNSSSVSGILHSVTLNMKDTGSSGSTVIEIYLAGNLITTKTIVAGETDYGIVEYFDMEDLIYPLDTFEVKVTQVATGAVDLKICLYEMTFPFDIDRLFFGNLEETTEIVGINRDYLFDNVDYWTIDFNQPLYSVTHLTITDTNNDVIDISNEIVNGNFYRSRIKMIPYTLTTVQKISVKVQDQNKKNFSFDYYPIVKQYFADYPAYVSNDSEEIEVFLPATYYRYSFDAGSTWFDWSSVSDTNTINLDFSGESTGSKTIKVQFRNGTDEVEEDVEIYYASGVVECGVDFRGDTADLSYSDVVPLARVEIYYDGSLTETITPVLRTGMDNLALDTVAKTITISAGSLYLNSSRYTWEGSTYTINPNFAVEGYSTNWKYTFGFNTVTRDFEFKEEVDDTPYVSSDDLVYTDFIPIWARRIGVSTDNIAWNPYTIGGFSEADDMLSKTTIDLNTAISKIFKIKFIDIAGRDREFTYDFNRMGYNIWREITVNSGNAFGSSYSNDKYPKYFCANAHPSSEDYWMSDVTEGLPQWGRYDVGLTDKKIIKEYGLAPYYTTQDGVPKTWKFQGSNDTSNWVDLDSVVNETGFSSYVTKYYAISNETAYAFYRVYITDASGGSLVRLRTFALRENIGGSDIVVYSEEEVLPGQIHQNPELLLSIVEEEWELDETSGGNE